MGGLDLAGFAQLVVRLTGAIHSTGGGGGAPAPATKAAAATNEPAAMEPVERAGEGADAAPGGGVSFDMAVEVIEATPTRSPMDCYEGLLSEMPAALDGVVRTYLVPLQPPSADAEEEAPPPWGEADYHWDALVARRDGFERMFTAIVAAPVVAAVDSTVVEGVAEGGGDATAPADDAAAKPEAAKESARAEGEAAEEGDAEPAQHDTQMVELMVTTAVVSLSQALGGLQRFESSYSGAVGPTPTSEECINLFARVVAEVPASTGSEAATPRGTAAPAAAPAADDTGGAAGAVGEAAEPEADFEEWMTWLWMLARRRFADYGTNLHEWLESIKDMQPPSAPPMISALSEEVVRQSTGKGKKSK